VVVPVGDARQVAFTIAVLGKIIGRVGDGNQAVGAESLRKVVVPWLDSQHPLSLVRSSYIDQKLKR
jgi:hypothetical protein